MANPGLPDEQIKEAFDYLKKYGNKQAAADALKIPRSTFQNRIRVGISRGYSPEHNMTRMVPESFQASRISTNYDKDGNINQQWVIATKDARRAQEAIDAVLEAFKDELPLAEPVTGQDNHLKELLTCYPVGDHHFGMLAWHEETGGDDYDIGIAENVLCKAMSYLVDKSPDSSEALIAVLGDFLHYDSMVAITPGHGNILDADSRFPQVVRAAMRSVRFMVREALRKHDKVRLILEIGNHDPSSTIMLMEMFSMHFENEPRVVVDRSPRNTHVYQFGKNLIGTHHGDKIKMDRLAGVIADDYDEMWGQTKYRVIHTGHVHHDHIKEYPGMKAESHGILAPKDAYAANGGWRSKQSMKAIYYHAEYGEVGRNIVKPEMIL